MMRSIEDVAASLGMSRPDDTVVGNNGRADPSCA